MFSGQTSRRIVLEVPCSGIPTIFPSMLPPTASAVAASLLPTFVGVATLPHLGHFIIVVAF